jgi:hypothetical protein
MPPAQGLTPRYPRSDGGAEGSDNPEFTEELFGLDPARRKAEGMTLNLGCALSIQDSRRFADCSFNDSPYF